MRYRFLFLLLLLSLSACTYQVQVLTPEPSVSLDGTTTQPATPPPVLTATSLPPTPTIVLPAFTPTALVQVEGVYPIKFNPNGTYIDIVDSILAGASTTYSVSASKGQIMSVSIDQGTGGDWVYIPIQITGADGTVICPQVANTECTFWRGVLPATQNYFVKIMPVNDIVNFTMRVAINPPGVATQSFQYKSAKQKATFSYTDEFAPVRFGDIPIYKITPELTLEFINSDFYANTNLVEAYFLYGSSTDSGIVSSCTQPKSVDGPETVIDHVTVNGVDFVHSEAVGAGAGNLFDTVYYRTLQNNVCYEVAFFIHSGNIGNYTPEVKEFDRAALLQRFESILSTLIIK